MSRKILLLCIEGVGEFSQHLPLGVLYVADALRKAGYDPLIIHDEATPQTYDKVFAEAKDCLFAGFSVKTDYNLFHVAALSKMIKDLGVPVVWGGLHPSLAPESALALEWVDYVVLGEGEISTPLLADAIRDGTSVASIRGIGHKENGTLSTITSAGFSELAPDLDAFEPLWELVDLQRYVIGPDRQMFFVESRGCPYECIFCYNTVVNKRRWRGHSVDYVLRQLDFLRSEAGMRHVFFTSDNFFVNKRRAFEIVEKMKMPWECSLVAEYIDEKFVLKAKRTGCRGLHVGAESGSESFLQNVKKGNTTLEDYLRAADLCTKYRIFIGFSFILGFPYETEEDRLDTLKFMLRLYKDYNCTVGIPKFLNPYPGTEAYTQSVNLGWDPPKTIEEWAENTRDKYILPFISPKRLRKYKAIRHCFRVLHTLRDLRSVYRWSPFVLWPLQLLMELRIKTLFTNFPLEIWAYDAIRKVVRKWKKRFDRIKTKDDVIELSAQRARHRRSLLPDELAQMSEGALIYDQIPPSPVTTVYGGFP
ncbi:MAG: radical SAM protein [bacterium]|nr:radical SAM protein [bacterium]